MTTTKGLVFHLELHRAYTGKLLLVMDYPGTLRSIFTQGSS